MLTILQYPNDHLRTKTKAVERVTPELLALANEMYTIMRQNNGIGLAAPQVGLDISLIVLEDGGKPLIMFNPQILKKSSEQEYGPEGCLSFNGITRIIKRPKEVTIKYRDNHGKMQYAVLKGLQARCSLHEAQHLIGVLFIDLEEKV